MNSKPLIKNQKFWPLCLTQFFGAFNDNFFKTALIILITFESVDLLGFSPEKLIAFCGGLFIFPFFLFSSLAGQIADKYEKSRLIVYIKILEILVMSLAVLGFLFMSLPLLLFVLFLTGLQSTLFSPLKYSYLPQQINPNQLLPANAWLQSFSFLAILAGAVCGGAVVAIPETGIKWVCIGVLLLAFIGFVFSLWIVKALPSQPELKINYSPFASTCSLISNVFKQKKIFLIALCLAWFWFYGSALLSLLPLFGRKVLGGDEQVVTLLLTLFSVGIGLGCLTCSLCEKFAVVFRLFSRFNIFSKLIGDRQKKLLIGYDKNELSRLTLSLIGSLGLSVFLFDLSLQSQFVAEEQMGKLSISAVLKSKEHIRILCDFALVAFSGAFFFVPFMTLLQKSAPKKNVSRIIAGSNIFDAIFIVLSACVLMACFNLGFSELEICFLLASLNLLALAGVLYWIMRRA